MTHNEYEMERDFVEPLMHFLTTNCIEYNIRDKSTITDSMIQAKGMGSLFEKVDYLAKMNSKAEGK